ncbi:MAG: hypothetical protein H6734_23885 [Alphaproteobacteria bacterium]|nr:hypothetical protein [Alphaproteobacteria bacterium]
MLHLLVACTTPAPPNATPDPAPPAPEPTTLTSAAGTYKRGPAAIFAGGSPCRVEHLMLLDGTRRTLFEVEGDCPTHCAFEDRMAVCVEGDAVVRHVYGGDALVLWRGEGVAEARRLYVAADGVPHLLTSREAVGAVLIRDQEVLVTGPGEVREESAASFDAYPAVLSSRAFDLDAPWRECPTLRCGGLDDVGSAIIAYRGKNGRDASGVLGWPDRPVVWGLEDGTPTGPVWVCADAACSGFEVASEGPAVVVRRPPWVAIREASGSTRILGLEEGAPSHDLGSTAWVTFPPLDLQLR